MSGQGSLFQAYSGQTAREGFDWPNLVGHRMEVGVDLETTGLDVYGEDTPVGIGIVAAGHREYLAWGHQSGPALPRDAVLHWFDDNVLDGRKTLIGANLKFDFSMLKKVGCDPEGRIEGHRDVLHEVALLSPDRRRKGLDLVSREFLGRGKLDPGKTPIWMQPSGVIEHYCLEDVQLAVDLDKLLLPRLEREGLLPVFEMEQALTWAVIHMEGEAFLVDVDKLARWREVARSRQSRLMMELSRVAGFHVHPGSAGDKARLFSQLGIKDFARTATMQPSFTMEWMEQYRAEPQVALLCDVLHVKSFREKYLDKYWEALRPDGKLRFSLHQLNADEGGTITGRFSASAPRGMPGFNPQQVFKVKEQKKISAIADMVVRELFIEDEDHEVFSADASQIEYRFFAHYVNDDDLTRRYREDPTTDIHQEVADRIGQDRDTVAKHANFAAVFGAGLDKFAYMINMSSEEARPVWEWYHKSFPGVRRLAREAYDAALARGWVKTLMGRKRWLKDEEHKALNTICQGGAADYGKLTTLDAYRNRKTLGVRLRCFVHDEIVGGLRRGAAGAKETLLDFLNVQRMPKLRVPITWDLKTGDTWRL